MKTRLAVLGLLLFLAVMLVWLLRQHEPVHPPPALPTTNVAQALQATSPGTPLATAGTNEGIPTREEYAATRAERGKKREAAIEHSYDEWRTPIDFYGRVIDENNNAVAGANVHFSWTDLSPTGSSERTTTSDGNGAFSLRNTTGKNLIVTVSKEGYYEYAPAGLAFNYAGENQNFVPDAGNPVVFRLRKKGEGADLIHYDKSFKLPRDGTPILIDLSTGSETSSSRDAFKVEGWTYDNEKKEGRKYDWKCRVSVPGGGLEDYDEQFPFLAPDSNYISEDVIDMPVTNGVSWSYIVHRNYYVKTSGGNFGRMVFTMVAGGDNFCELNLYFNPAGSRNLESMQ